MNRKERRKDLTPTRIHAKFIYSEKQDLPVRYEDKKDGRKIAYITVEGYASTKVKDGSGDIVQPDGIDLSRFEAGNAPLKAMHGRGILSNVGVIQSAKADDMGLYIKAEARLDITKDNNGRPINEQDYTLYDRLMNRTINGFSVGFHNIKEGRDEDLRANVIYTMTLHEVSLVDVPDNPLTIVKMLELHHDLSSDTNMKKTLADFIVKSLGVSDMKVGEMYRVQKVYEERNWKYVVNSELVKMSTTDEGASEENPMCYFLAYELDLDGYKPSTSVIKTLLTDVKVVDITPEQLKELQEAETKDLETEDEEDGEEDKEEDEKVEDNNSQEQEVLGNEDGDTPEKGDAGEGEKMITLTKDLETKDKTIGELQAKVKELEDEKAEVQKENEELATTNEQLQTDLDEAQKAFFEVSEAYTNMKGKYETAGKTLAAVRGIKTEHGLKHMEDQETKKGNVAVAYEEAIKQL